MKRCCIYFFFDKQGIVDDYVEYVLREMRDNVEHLIVVCNGLLLDSGKEKLDKFADEIIVRENVGFDVWAYKTALDHLGWQELVTYDEVILMNYTIMGPLYSLKDMFGEMERRTELDFWGITKCFEERSPIVQKMWGCPYGFIPEHIQSSFTVFRRSILESAIFQEYWNGMPMIKSYYESGGRHEQYITKYFADNGFIWDCYTSYEGLDEDLYKSCPLIIAPMEVVKNRKSPFFKRRSFFTMKTEYSMAIPQMRDFMDFLENETDYDTDMIYSNLIRTCNQSDIVENLMMLHII